MTVIVHTRIFKDSYQIPGVEKYRDIVGIKQDKNWYFLEPATGKEIQISTFAMVKMEVV